MQQPDGYEEAARIVEAFSVDQPDHVMELLERVAQAIRDRALDD